MEPVPICNCPNTFKLEANVEVPVVLFTLRSPANVEAFVFVTARFVIVVVPSHDVPLTVRAEDDALLNMFKRDQVFAVYSLGIVVDE
jgi:hypothetical protein